MNTQPYFKVNLANFAETKAAQLSRTDALRNEFRWTELLARSGRRFPPRQPIPFWKTAPPRV